jgi:hypothetical protein
MYRPHMRKSSISRISSIWAAYRTVDTDTVVSINLNALWRENMSRRDVWLAQMLSDRAIPYELKRELVGFYPAMDDDVLAGEFEPDRELGPADTIDVPGAKSAIDVLAPAPE